MTHNLIKCFWHFPHISMSLKKDLKLDFTIRAIKLALVMSGTLNLCDIIKTTYFPAFLIRKSRADVNIYSSFNR